MATRLAWWVSLTAAGAIGTALVAGPALAQDPDPGTDTGTDTETETLDHYEERRQAFKEALAEELGVSVEELEAAFRTVRERLQADARPLRRLHRHHHRLLQDHLRDHHGIDPGTDGDAGAEGSLFRLPASVARTQA